MSATYNMRVTQYENVILLIESVALSGGHKHQTLLLHITQLQTYCCRFPLKGPSAQRGSGLCCLSLNIWVFALQLSSNLIN
jgi:hypothetical protein